MQNQMDFGASMPVENPTEAFWQSEPDLLISNYRSTNFPTEADVVVIGSGLTGAFIAHRLLSSDSTSKPKSVVILEARTAASGATGRNGKSHSVAVLPTAWCSVASSARTLDANGHLQGVTSNLTVTVALPHTLSCTAQRLPKSNAPLKLSTTERRLPTLENGLAEETDLVQSRSADDPRNPYKGFKEAGGDVSEITVFEKAEAEETLRVSNCYGAITYPAASLWPWKLAIAVLKKGIDLGLQLHTNTPITGVSAADGSSGRCKVTTNRGDIMASKVIHATNGYSPHLLPELEGRIIPLKGHVSAIVPPPAYDEQPLSTSFAFVDDEDYDYLIQRPGPKKYLIWGGGEIAHPEGLTGGFGDCGDSTNVAEVQKYIQKDHLEATFELDPSTAIGLGFKKGFNVQSHLPVVGNVPAPKGDHMKPLRMLPVDS
ncbi:26S proteasome regulatory subunit N1 [Apiospora arundinis]